MQSNTIRELSYSPNQKYLNEKTRKERIPWKIQKKGIDDKLTSETIYNKYMKKIKKYNPLKPYGNKKIKMQKNNIKINRNNNNNKNTSHINNRTLKSIKVDTKILNQTTIENKDSLKHFENKLNKNILNKTNIQYKESEKEKIKEKDYLISIITRLTNLNSKNKISKDIILSQLDEKNIDKEKDKEKLANDIINTIQK